MRVCMHAYTYTHIRIRILGLTYVCIYTHIWIYAQNDKVKLKENNSSSSVGNRIEKNNSMEAKEWEMIELVYDGARSKWIIMHHD